MEDGHARAHVQIHPTSDLFKSNSQPVSKHTPHLNAIGPAVVELPMERVSPTPSPRLLGTCHVPWQAPAGIGVGQIRNLLNGDIEQRRPLVNRSTRSRDISLSKASWGRVGSGWVGSGRAAHTEISPLNHRRTRSALRAPLVIIVYLSHSRSSIFDPNVNMNVNVNMTDCVHCAMCI